MYAIPDGSAFPVARIPQFDVTGAGSQKCSSGTMQLYEQGRGSPNVDLLHGLDHLS